MTYTQVGQQAYIEAVRTVPGLLGAWHRGDEDDAALLLRGFIGDIQKMGLSPEECWAVMFNASMHWTKELTKALAKAEGDAVCEVVQRMGALAAGWNPDGD